MFNVETGTRRPIPGAPIPGFLSMKYPRVCKACFALHSNPRLSLDYWEKIDRENRQAAEKRKKDIDGLSGRKDYFTGL